MSKDTAAPPKTKNDATTDEQRSPEQHRGDPKTPEASVEPVEKSAADSTESPNQAEKFTDHSSPKSTEKRDSSPKIQNTTEKCDTNSKRSISRSPRLASPATPQEKEDGEITNEIAATIKETPENKQEKADHGKRDRRIEDKTRNESRKRYGLGYDILLFFILIRAKILILFL